MNLRLPFDNKGLHIGYDIEATYGDFRKKWSPVGSLLVSDSWDTGIGRIGLLGALSYSQPVHPRRRQCRSRTSRLATASIATTLNTSGTPVCRNPLPTDTDTQGFPTSIPPNAANPGSRLGPLLWRSAFRRRRLRRLAADLRYAPIGAQFRTQDFDRIRRGYAGAAQWQSLDRRALLTAQFLRSHATESWGEHVMETGSDLSEYNTYPVGCRPNLAAPGIVNNNAASSGAAPEAQCPVGGFTNYQYDDQGVFQSGYITLPVGGWRGSPYPGGSGGRPRSWGRQPDHAQQPPGPRNQHRQRRGLNFKFSPNPHWDINLDGQYVKANTTISISRSSAPTSSTSSSTLPGQFRRTRCTSRPTSAFLHMGIV